MVKQPCFLSYFWNFGKKLIELEIDNTHPCKAENCRDCDKNGHWHCQTVGNGFDQHNPCPEPICVPAYDLRKWKICTCVCEVAWFGNTFQGKYARTQYP